MRSIDMLATPILTFAHYANSWEMMLAFGILFLTICVTVYIAVDMK
jgi:hypothetical protein